MKALIEKVKQLFEDTVTFCAKDVFTDIFLYDCHRAGINLRKIEIKDNEIKAVTNKNNMCRLNEIAQYRGALIDIIEVKGPKAFLKKIFGRLGVSAGIFSGAVLFLFLSSIIWNISINAPEGINTDSVKNILANNGICKGNFIYNADCKKAGREITASNSDIYSTVVNINGCNVSVFITESHRPEITVTDTTYSNLVAKTDGIISETDIFAGEECVKAGDVVKKGDLLVSGVYETANGKNYLTDSSAVIKAETEKVLVVSTANNPTVLSVKHSNDMYSLHIFGAVLLNCSNKAGVSKYRTDYFAENGRTVIPIGVSRLRKTVFAETSKELDENESYLLCFTDLSVGAVEILAEKEEISRSLSISLKGQTKIEAVFRCIEDICEKRYFEVDLNANP